jgi:stage II sporulation protein R
VKKAWGIVILILVLGIAFPVFQHLLKKQEAFTPNSLIRIHIVAHSDSSLDQDIKLRVRDRLVKWLSPQLAACNSAQESRMVLAQNLNVIQEEARREIKARQGTYGASVMLGEFDFPVRSYGEITLPAGKYQALKVVLGDGNGTNWWCVLYPPLCVGKTTEAEKDVRWFVSRFVSNLKKKT